MSADRPSLTPYSDEVERAITHMMAQLNEQKKNPDLDQISVRMTEALLVPAIRAIGVEMEMHSHPQKIMEGVAAAVANLIASAVSTLVQKEARVIGANLFLMTLAQDLAYRMNPENVPESSKTSFDFDFPKEGTA